MDAQISSARWVKSVSQTFNLRIGGNLALSMKPESLRSGLLWLRRTRIVNGPAPEKDDSHDKQTDGQRRKNPPAPVIGKEVIVVVLR